MLVIKSIKLNATPISRNKILRKVRVGYGKFDNTQILIFATPRISQKSMIMRPFNGDRI